MRAAVAALVVATAAASTVRADVTAPGAGVVLRASDGDVLDARRAKECLFYEQVRFFTPSASDVRRIEALLPAAIAAEANKQPETSASGMAKRVLERLGTDKRLYAGVIEGKRRFIEVHGYAHLELDPSDKFRCPMMVTDGGSGVWYIRFEIARGTFDLFSTGGVG